jgi:hypothetical protein
MYMYLPSLWVVMYMCVRDIDFVSVPQILRSIFKQFLQCYIFVFQYVTKSTSITSYSLSYVYIYVDECCVLSWIEPLYSSLTFDYLSTKGLKLLSYSPVCLSFLSEELYNSLRFRFRFFISLKSNWCLLFVYWKLKCEHIEWAFSFIFNKYSYQSIW